MWYDIWCIYIYKHTLLLTHTLRKVFLNIDRFYIPCGLCLGMFLDDIDTVYSPMVESGDEDSGISVQTETSIHKFDFYAS